MASPRTTILCADDSPDIAGLLQATIDGQPDMKSVGCVTEADQILSEVARLRPDVVIIDLSMPGIDTLVVVRDIAAKHPETRTVIYSGYDDRESMDRAIDAGAWGFVSKHGDMNALVAAVRRVAAGELAVGRR